jgi:hypothetical protein
MTPENLPVPELLLAEPSLTGQAVLDISNRLSTSVLVTAKQLETPVSLTTLAVSCSEPYITNPHWNIPVQHMPVPKTYYSSTYGGKYKYVDSFLINCTPQGSSNTKWARHRIYYKNAWGNYVKHYEAKLKPWQWDIETRGSVKRYRRVAYDHNWSSGCGSCQYGREGKFRN